MSEDGVGEAEWGEGRGEGKVVVIVVWLSVRGGRVRFYVRLTGNDKSDIPDGSVNDVTGCDVYKCPARAGPHLLTLC